MSTDARITKIEERVDVLIDRIDSFGRTLKGIGQAVDALADDVRRLDEVRKEGELREAVERRSKSETERRVAEALDRYGLEEYPTAPTGVKPKPSMAPSLPPEVTGGFQVEAPAPKPGEMLARYVVETPRPYLAGFILLLFTLFIGGSGVAVDMFEWITGHSDRVALSDPGMDPSVHLPEEAQSPPAPAPE